MSTDSPQVKLIHELVRAFETKDLALFAKYSHDDLRRVNYPRSLGKPDQTKEEWLGGLEKGMSLWTGDGKLTVHSIIEAPGKVVFHFSTNAKTSIGVDANLERLLIITFATDEDGILKMKQIDGFTDSKMDLEFAEAVAEAKANKQLVA